MPDQTPQFLDANGNPTDGPLYLDANGNPITPRETPSRSWTDTAVDALPMVGGAVGGAIGTAGGAAFGLGFGGIPGAIGGAAAGGATGEAVRQLANRARGVSAPATPTDAAGQIATQGGIQGALEGTGQAVMAGVTPVAQSVYRGYLKPSLSRVNLPKAAQIVRTAIEENIPMTKGGLAHADQLIGELKGKVDDLLSQATGKTVNLSEIAGDVRAWAKRMYDRPGRDPRDYEAAVKVADRIDGHPSLQNPFDPLSDATSGLPAANRLKRDLQGAARDKFGVPGGTAETAGEKYASGAMRRGIEAQVPAVGPINARESQLIDLARALQRGTGRDANMQKIYGVRAIASAGFGGEEYARTGNAYSAAAKALAMDIGLHPAVATRAAILAAKLGDRVPGTAIADVGRAAVQAALEAQQ